MLPSGYKATKLYDILGNDYTVSRNSTKTRLFSGASSPINITAKAHSQAIKVII